MGKLSIMELGQPIEVEVVRYYTKNDTNYLIYTKNEKDEQGYIKLYAAKITEENGTYITSDITNPTEWNEVKETMKQTVKENKESTPVSITDLDVSTLNLLNVTERHVFKLAENIVSYLGLHQDEVESSVEESEVPAVEQTISEEGQGNEPQFDVFNPVFTQPIEENNETSSEVQEEANTIDDIEELDLSGIRPINQMEEISEEVNNDIEEANTKVELPEEELTDVTLMNVSNDIEDKSENNENEGTWNNFEMPVPLAEEVSENTEVETSEEPTVEQTVSEVTEETTEETAEKEEKHKGFFGSLFGKKQKEEESKEEEMPKEVETLENNDVESKEEITEDSQEDSSLEQTQILTDLMPSSEDLTDAPTPIEETIPVEESSSLEENPLSEEENIDTESTGIFGQTYEVPATDESVNTTFDFNNFDPLNEQPSYEIPSFESLGLEDNSETEVSVETAPERENDSVDLEEAKYQTLYFEEKRKNEEMEEKIHSLQIELDLQKKKIEEVKNIIL